MKQKHLECEIDIKNKNYPRLLKEIFEPPNTIYIRGAPNILNKTCISIVGTRKFTEYGEYVTKKIIRELSISDIVIVSGLARGIDTIAHKEALKNGLKTVAVLGHGLDFVYPRENNYLYDKISRKGALLTEYQHMIHPTKFTFPARNQLISGLSLATIVIEAPLRSGALITARASLDQGRDVFVVPGDVDRENSLGNLSLLQKGGAYPISSGKEVLDILNLQPSLFTDGVRAPKDGIKRTNLNLKNLNNYEKEIIQVFVIRKLYSFEEILSKTIEKNTSKTLITLTELEIKQIIAQKHGKYKLLI